MIGRSFIFVSLFLKQHVNIDFQHVLASTINKKIMLTSDVCFRRPIIIKSYNFHANDIKRGSERDSFLP
jgi:hypothetical protein